MNKIEEILQNNLKHNPFSEPFKHQKDIIKAIKEFGRLAFEAGRSQYWDDGGTGCLEFKYYEYEDFLKEIEDEEGN